ncbi:MAG: CRISPR-associated helicase Cas3' [Anaerolineaceae bacterium]
MTYYGHSLGENKEDWQLLKDHLTNTAELTKQLVFLSGVSEFAYIMGLFHDIGKYSNKFQIRLNGSAEKVDHATAGAKEIIKIFNQNKVQSMIATLMAYCIIGHHSGLPDYGNPTDLSDEGTFLARLKKSLEDYSNYQKEIAIKPLNFPIKIPIHPTTRDMGFSLSFFTRFLYSLLTDADFQETENFLRQLSQTRGDYPEIDEYCRLADRYTSKFDNPKTEINKKRTEIFRDCLSKSEQPTGLFSLTVPTGGGKTISSLAFALRHAKANGLKRIIYVIPYTTIIEQTSNEFKNIFGSGNVLEHHSNFDFMSELQNNTAEINTEYKNTAINKLKLATENWDIPLIVTTNVQFFESIFSNRSSKCRKIHNIAQSVVIFDEAQMFPVDYLQPCMSAVYELVINYKCSSVFCTATQPELNRFLPNHVTINEIMPDPINLYQFFKRVKVEFLGKRADEDILDSIVDKNQALLIVNTRKHAKGLFQKLESCGKFHLSTLMCPTHRTMTIRKIKATLENKEICHVISTQIMEAGIDVDFPIGFRSLSGLDSIIQAAGRVNREGKNKSGELFVFEPDTELIKKIPASIKQKAAITKRILMDFEDPISLEAIKYYYELLYDLQGKNAFDINGVLECFSRGIPEFDFKTASEKFSIIDSPTVPVIIQFNEEVKALLREMILSDFPRSFTRKLQPFIVNIYEQEYWALKNNGLIDEYAETFSVLNNDDFYDQKTGLKIPEITSGEGIFL